MAAVKCAAMLAVMDQPQPASKPMDNVHHRGPGTYAPSVHRGPMGTELCRYRLLVPGAVLS